MSLDNYQQDLLALVDVAQKQGNRLNLSIIMITLKCSNDNIQEVIKYLHSKNIEIINDDVEPDCSDETETTDGEFNTTINPFDPSKIDIKMDKLTMDTLIKRIMHTEIEFDSSFQRKAGLWTKKQKSQLIESMLLRIPLPAFYFDASDDDKWLIIDGLQRLGTIKEYVVEQSFALIGMEFLKDFDGLRYDELPRAMQRRIEETNVNAYLVNPITPKNVKFNIFKRINTGGLVLEPQEIRNALYQGQATEFISKLAGLSSFTEATDGSIKSERMQDREFCLRFVAFTELPWDTYTGNMDEFLNQAMEYLSRAQQPKLDFIEKNFKRAMDSNKALFGNNAFRKMFEDGRRRPVNKALFEGWSSLVVGLNKDQLDKLLTKNDVLIQSFIVLCADKNFQNELSASDRNSFRNRIQRLKDLVEKTLQGETIL